MQIALISDIHGNAVALEEVLSQLNQEEPDQIICLGDIAATGPQPITSLERIKQLDCTVVMGNTDEWILNPVMDEEADESLQRIQEIDNWCAKQLSRSHKQYIKSFKKSVEVNLGDDTRLLCYHGSPQSHSDRIEATTPESDLDKFFEGVESQILAGAHTHVQLFRRYVDKIVLNTGSIGLPHERNQQREIQNPPWAEWAMISISNGSINAELRRTPFDAENLIKTVSESEMPHADYWSQGWRI